MTSSAGLRRRCSSMGDLYRVTGPGRAEALAAELNRGRRNRPAVVVSTPNGASVPWIDTDRLVSELGDLADVYLLATLESSWAFSTAMPSRTQVYGGAGRVYPVTLDWVHDPTRSRLRFAYSAAEGETATAELIEDGLAAALHGGALALRPGEVTAAEIVGVVKGCPTTSQALVAVSGGYATIQMGMTLPGVSSEQVFALGMRVFGVLDEESRRLDVRASLPDPTVRLAAIGDGEILRARVEAVRRDRCEIAPYPGTTVSMSWEEVTANAEDDLRDLMSVGEILTVRSTRWADGTLRLSLIGVDELEVPGSALSVFADGPPWLLPTETPAPGPSPEIPDAPAPESLVPPSPTVRPSTMVPPSPMVPTSPLVPPPAMDETPVVDETTTRTESAPRPTPLLLGPRRPDQSETVVTPTVGRTALQGMSRQLEAARARTAELEAVVATSATNLRATQAELLMLERDLSSQARELAARESDLRRLRARIRKTVQEERRTAGRREIPPGEDLFLDPAEQFRFEVEDRWARRIPAAEKAERPLRNYGFGPKFLDSLDEIHGLDRAKVADVVVDVLTGLADNSVGRDMHPLRTGTGGDDPALRREGYSCWRVAIQRRSPQARRLHFWRSADDIELSRVVLHDDYAP
jgi:hypothetical protein